MDANAANAIAGALVNQARADMAKARAVDAARPKGERRVDLDFSSKADRNRPVEDYDFWHGGRHYKGMGARWAVFTIVWNGAEWVRERRLSGPLQFTAALDRVVLECKRLGLERRP